MKSEGYLYGKNCSESEDFQKCKNFLLKWIPQSKISWTDSCYYLNNYNHIQIRGGHRYARASYAAKFILKDNMKYFHKGQMEYCYHGTRFQSLKSIIEQGLKIPNGKQVKVRNGDAYGTGIYSTKIPEYAQLYADPEQFNNEYFQAILLLRQDLAKIKCEGQADLYGIFSKKISSEYSNISKVHLLHSQLMKKTDIQWVTQEESSITIEGILVKRHKIDPQFGEFKQISQLISELQTS